MKDEPPPPIPNSALFGLLVTLTTWPLLIAVDLVEGHHWAEILLPLLSLAAGLYLLMIGRKAAAPYWRHGGRVTLSTSQAFLVILYMLAFGVVLGLAVKFRVGQ